MDKTEFIARLKEILEKKGIRLIEKEEIKQTERQEIERQESKYKEVATEEKKYKRKKFPLSDEQLLQLAKIKRPKEIAKELAKKYDVKEKSVLNKLYNLGVRCERGSQVNISPEELDKLYQKYTAKEIAELLGGISQVAVESKIHRLGIKKRKKPRFTEEELRRDIKIKTIDEIAKDKGVSRGTVERYLYKVYGIRLKDWDKKRAELLPKIEQLLDEGKSISEIVQELGKYQLKYHTVYGWVKNLGYKKKLLKKPSKKKLREIYIAEDCSVREVAKKLKEQGYPYSTKKTLELLHFYGLIEKKEMLKRKWEERRKKILEREVAKGTPIKEIGNKLGLKVGGVRHLQRKYGIKYKRYEPIDKEELHRDYIEKGLSKRKIAKKNKISVKTVSKYIEKYKYDKEKREIEKEKENKERQILYNLRQKGYSIYKISNELRKMKIYIHPNTVKGKLKKYGMYKSFKGKPIEQLRDYLYEESLGKGDFGI
jgi:DNA-binding CsgD family transcriptional regulator